MRKISVILIAAGVFSLAAKAPKDPVLLEVDGRPVTLSEFEYYYHKNDGNEIEKQTPEEYLQLFIDYKLKVAQARHERRDTTAEYQKDLKAFRHELALPYLQDQETYDELVNTSYKHTQSHRKIDHLMLATNQRALADSLREVWAAGADIEDLVARYSIDPSKTQNKGHYDWIGAGQFPYEFEEIVYDTPIGEVSQVVATSYGFHIVRPIKERKYLGDVRAGHILVKMDQNSDSAAAKARIDSIYSLLQQGVAFETLARTNSDCPSAEKDGDLGFFGPGKMVPEFEEVVFSMENNSVSEPFLTRFGWHIVKRYEDQLRPKAPLISQIEEAMKHDIRAARPRLVRAEKLKKELNFRINQAGLDKIYTLADEIGYDSARVVLKDDPTPIFFVGDSISTIADYIATGIRVYPNQGTPSEQLKKRLDGRITASILSYEERNLDKIPAYKRQADEYADDLMLVASLEDNVWNVAGEHPEQLKAYFEQHRDEYAFEQPRWKGYVIYSTSDSLKQEVDRFLEEVKPSPDVLGDSLKVRFPRGIRTERIVLPQGENAVVDYIAFNGPEPRFSNRFSHLSTYMGHVINAPEEVADVRARVTNDFTRNVETRFVEELRERYPVKIYPKVLKKVK